MSIHSIRTFRRESFYWAAILCTFALGTAAGDLFSEKLSLGYWKAALIFAVAITLVTVSHFTFKLNAVIAFWTAYIMTRPLGGSLGDYLSQANSDGGLGWGTTRTSVLFLVAIGLIVAYITVSKVDAVPQTENP